MEFRTFLAESENSDFQQTLKRLPKSHQKLVKGYSLHFQSGNGLKNDTQHIGVVDPNKKTITIAAPWRYGREMSVLHEVGHLVWQTLSHSQKEQWKRIVKKTKIEKEFRQKEEELFCMGYGATYSTHPPTTYHHDEWIKFIKKLK